MTLSRFTTDARLLEGLRLSVLSMLLQGVEKLENFAFTSSSDTIFGFSRLNRDLRDALKVHDKRWTYTMIMTESATWDILLDFRSS